jgi:hypothetical protein
MSSLNITYTWTHNGKSDNIFWQGKCDELQSSLFHIVLTGDIPDRQTNGAVIEGQAFPKTFWPPELLAPLFARPQEIP